MKEYIIKKSYHIDALVKKRDSAANKHFVVYKSNNNISHYRFAISVGKKYGNAVERNKIKRQIRHIIRKTSREIKASYDILIVICPIARNLSFSEIENYLKQALERAKILVREDNLNEEKIN